MANGPQAHIWTTACSIPGAPRKQGFWGSGEPPEIWVPFLWGKKAPAASYPQARGFQKYGALFFWEKKRLWQRTHKLRASRNLAPFDSGRKTRFSNGLAYNRSKVSVTKSEIGFVVVNFSRSIFPYMSNIYENG